jgi:hypothetical protein
VDIYLDTTELALTGTNSTGAFSGVKIQVLASALPGTNWVTGVRVLRAIPRSALQRAHQLGTVPFRTQSQWTEPARKCS